MLATGQVVTGSLPTREVIRRAAALEPPEPEPLPREAIRLPGGAGNTTRGEGVSARRRLRGRVQEHLLLRGLRRLLLGARAPGRGRLRGGALRGRRGGSGRDRRDPPGRSTRARDGGRHRRLGLDGARRLGRLVLGLSHDLDGGGRDADRVQGCARGARSHGRGRRRRRARLPAPAHVPARSGDGPDHGRAGTRRARGRGNACRRRGRRRARPHAGRLGRDRPGRRPRAEPTRRSRGRSRAAPLRASASR